jgi:hypothetical protein
VKLNKKINDDNKKEWREQQINSKPLIAHIQAYAHFICNKSGIETRDDLLA